MPTERDELLEEVTRRLVAELDPDAIYLFGSYAWGTPDQESDIDLLVVVPEADAAARFRLATRGRTALRGLGIAKDVLVRSRRGFAERRGRKGTLEHSVGAQGRLLYARG